MGAAKRPHAARHEAADGHGRLRRLKWRLCEELRSQGVRDTTEATSPTASPSPGLAISNHSSHQSRRTTRALSAVQHPQRMIVLHCIRTGMRSKELSSRGDRRQPRGHQTAR